MELEVGKRYLFIRDYHFYAGNSNLPDKFEIGDEIFVTNVQPGHSLIYSEKYNKHYRIGWHSFLKLKPMDYNKYWAKLNEG